MECYYIANNFLTQTYNNSDICGNNVKKMLSISRIIDGNLRKMKKLGQVTGDSLGTPLYWCVLIGIYLSI